jgi:N5-(cytidine 5'-diphosphoramidyl)-L-glutamine hydrolase
MNRRSKIGLTMRVVETREYEETRDAISHDWIKFLEANGFQACLIPNSVKDLGSYFSQDKLAGVILSNGNSVIPNGQESFPPGSPDFIRNESEKRVLAHCIANKIPVLAVCRGMQFVNYFLGGGLIGDINEGRGEELTHVKRNHFVSISYKPLQILCGADFINVNSYHNQGFTPDLLARDLILAGVSGDIVEAYVHKSLPIVGIQWHPEREGASGKLDLSLLNSMVSGFADLI